MTEEPTIQDILTWVDQIGGVYARPIEGLWYVAYDMESIQPPAPMYHDMAREDQNPHKPHWHFFHNGGDRETWSDVVHEFTDQRGPQGHTRMEDALRHAMTVYESYMREALDLE